MRLNVPHGHFRMLRSYFGSEYAIQGHGDNYVVLALQAFIKARPYFCVVPCPPHAHAFKAENTIHQITGHAFTNACRARLGPAAWSLLDHTNTTAGLCGGPSSPMGPIRHSSPAPKP